MATIEQLSAARAVIKECGYVISDHSLGKLVDAAEAVRVVPGLPTREALARELQRVHWETDGTQRPSWEAMAERAKDAWLAEADYVMWLISKHTPAPSAAPLQVTDGDVFDACMTWRHDFGLLKPGDEDRTNLEYDMRKILTHYADRLSNRQPAEPAPVVEPARVVEWLPTATQCERDWHITGGKVGEWAHDFLRRVLGDRVSLPAQKSGNDWNQCLVSQLRTANASVEEEHAALRAAAATALTALESTRWMQSGVSLGEFAKSAEGENHRLVCEAMTALRGGKEAGDGHR